MKQPNYQYDNLADLDTRIVQNVKAGLPICARPYKAVATALDMGEMALILRIHHLIREHRISRQRPSLWNVNDPRMTKTLLTHWDKQLLALLRRGLPLSSRPFHIFAKELELSPDEVLFRTTRLREAGYLQHIGPLI
ncbi:MAG: Lrp/AsnC family transcriptional regulator [Ketobacteraceae bacterium]|nr:Lrp/AsnC family transcriptional regulator [Ketobacteraceae bacterium]